MPEGDSQAGFEQRLSRDLGVFDITMIGVGAMIGAGIFVLTGIAAGTAGPALILAFALNGLVTILTAMVYAELGSAVPEAGGGYLWVKLGLPGGNAFLSGWMSWFAHAVAGSLYALGFGSYLDLTLSEVGWLPHWLQGDVFHKGIGVAIALFFIFVNYRGASETGAIGNIVTLAKVAILAVFVGSGVLKILSEPASWEKFVPFSPEGLGGVFAAMGLTYIAFEGYEIIVQAGEEVKDPRRNIPRAIFLSLAIVIPVYILVAFACLGAVDTGGSQATWQWLGAHAEVGIAEAARQFMPLGTVLLLLGGLMSTMSALNATTFSSTRVAFAMGRDRYLPDFFSRVHSRRRTPHLALAASGTLIIGMLVALPIEDVAAAADIMFLLLFLQVNVAALTIRKRYGEKLAYGFLTPFFPAVPLLAIGAQLFLAVYLFRFSPIAWVFAAGWMGAGYGLWRLYASGREREAEVSPIILEEREPAPREAEEVLVPLANPRTAPGILQVASRLARERNATLAVLYVVTVPGQIPRRAGRQFLREARPYIEKIQAAAEATGVPFRTIVRIARKPYQAILDTVEEVRAAALVVGWKGRTKGPEKVLGKNIDYLFRRANVDTVVVRETAESFRRILVITDGPPSTRLALGAAATLLRDGREARVDVLYIAGGGGPYGQFDPDALKGLVAEVQERRPDVPIRLREERSDRRPSLLQKVFFFLPRAALRRRYAAVRDLTRCLRQISPEYDRVVLPAMEEGWLQRWVVGGPETVLARASEAPVIIVKARQRGVKFGIQRFFQFFREEEEA